VPPHDKDLSETIQQGPLTFDPSPPLKEGEDIKPAAADEQAKLMQWHYHLGHLGFPKLKQLALNGEISKKLAKIKPPKCAGCLFGTMNKLPWHGKETKASHEVFIAAKLGKWVSVDQMTLTEVGFYARSKGKFTKKCNKCAPIFVNHYSRLHFSASPNQQFIHRDVPKNLPSNNMLQNTASESYTTAGTTSNSTTMPSNKPATMHGKSSPFVA
jgi:hypothetical protein